jgi:hypothetical protein
MIHQGPRFRLWRTASGREAGRHARADSKGSAPSDRRTCTDDTNGQVRDRRRLHPTPRQRWPPGMRSWQRSEASHVGSVVAPPPDDHAPEQKAARMPGPAGVPTGRVPGTSRRSAAVPVRRTLARQHATCNPACGGPVPTEPSGPLRVILGSVALTIAPMRRRHRDSPLRSRGYAGRRVQTTSTSRLDLYGSHQERSASRPRRPQGRRPGRDTRVVAYRVRRPDRSHNPLCSPEDA